VSTGQTFGSSNLPQARITLLNDPLYPQRKSVLRKCPPLRSGPVLIDQLHLGVRVAVGEVRVPTLDQIPERFAVKIDVMSLDIELAQSARAQLGGAVASQSEQDHHRVGRDFPLAPEPSPDGASLDLEAKSAWLILTSSRAARNSKQFVMFGVRSIDWRQRSQVLHSATKVAGFGKLATLPQATHSFNSNA